MPATIVRCSVPTSIDSFISFFDFGTRSAVEHLRDAQLDLHEVVDGDARRRPARRRGGAVRPARLARALRGGAGADAAADRSHGVSLVDIVTVAAVASRRGQSGRPCCNASRSPSARQRASRSSRRSRRRMRHAEPAQDLRRRLRHDRQQQHGRDADRLGRVEQHLRRARSASPDPCASAHGSRLGDELVGGVDEPERRRRAVVRARSRPSRRGSRARPSADRRASRSAAGAAAAQHGRRDTGRAIAVTRLTRLPRLFARSAL